MPALRSLESKKKSVTLILPPPHPRQAEFLSLLDKPGVRFAVGACGTKFGKLEILTNLLPTPQGWRQMGDIHVGDYVFDENGAPTQVTYETPVHQRKCYEVVFQDGASVVVGAEHLWLTETYVCRKANARVRSKNDRCKSTAFVPVVRDTEEIKRTLYVTFGGITRPNHSIPVCGAVQYPEQVLSVDPYVLGVWLGDGTSTSGDITNIDDEVLDNVGLYYHKYMTLSRESRGQTWSFDGLRKSLNLLGLIGNKHVPSQYLIASVPQRLALLQGLMDTDGTISKRGDCCFDNTNKSLADAVEELANSLGIKTNRGQRVGKCNGEAKKLCYRVHFTTDLPVFRLRRKAVRIRPVAAKAKRRYIVDVRQAPTAPAKCIRVASPSHLYLTGRSYIVTHNTYGCTIWLVKEAWEHKNSINWWVALTFPQAKMAYSLIKRLLPKDTYIEYKADLRLVLTEPDGSEHSVIEFKSADNSDSLRGFAVNAFVLDEAARMMYESFVSIVTTVTQTRGHGIIISTPKGRGWFFDVYQRGEKFEFDGTPKYSPHQIDCIGKECFCPNVDPFPEWMSVRLPTWTNPHVAVISIVEAQKNLPSDVFQQEFAAEFLDDSAGVFRNVNNCIKGQLFEDYIPGYQYVLGVDLARIRDYTVLTVLDTTRNHVVYVERFNQVAWEWQYHKIIQVARRYHAVVCVDWTGIGDPIVETLRGAGLQMQPYKIGGSAAKQQLIEKLRVNIENGKISFPLNKYTQPMIRELKAFEYSFSEGGIIKYSAPSGSHDDCVISLALANWIGDVEPWVYRHWNQRGV